MIFPLTQVTGGIDKIYDVPLEFLTKAQLSKICSDTLVPMWFKPVYNRCGYSGDTDPHSGHVDPLRWFQ